VERRLENNPLLKLNDLIEWEKLGKILGNMGRSGYGPQGYPPLSLFKALILQAWHSLSDPALEEALRVRLDFMTFTGFESEVPDETTFCRFRGLLNEKGLWQSLLDEVNHQLQSQNLQVKPAQAAIVDATLISSAARPRKTYKGYVQEGEVHIEENLRLSADPDAKWIKKGKVSTYGYKGFVVVGAADGAIQRTHMTPANASECPEMERALGSLLPKRLLGDKGYASQKNWTLLGQKGIKNGLMYKAKRGKLLTSHQKRFNKLISKTRFRVEQCFGTLKRQFDMARSSYMGLLATWGQFTGKAIAFNLNKALRQVKWA
jgi:IS5 family transposase